MADNFKLTSSRNGRFCLTAAAGLLVPRRAPVAAEPAAAPAAGPCTVTLESALRNACLGHAPPPGWVPAGPPGCLFVRETTRKELVLSEITVLGDLDNARLSFNNAHCRLVLGPPGVGKSSALQHLTYANALAHANTVSVYADLKEYKHPTRISQLVFDAIATARGDTVETPRDGESVLTYLARCGLRVFLVVDEAQWLWRASSKAEAVAAAHSITDLYGWANSDAGLIHVILAGSAAVLRALAFHHADVSTLPDEYKAVYKREMPPSLNPTRVIPAPFHAPRTGEDFMEVLHFWWGQQPAGLRAAASANLCGSDDDGGDAAAAEAWNTGGDANNDEVKAEQVDAAAADVLPDAVTEWPNKVLRLVALLTGGNFQALSRCTSLEFQGLWTYESYKTLARIKPLLGALREVIARRPFSGVGDGGNCDDRGVNPWGTLRTEPLATLQERMDAKGQETVATVTVSDLFTWADQGLIVVDTASPEPLVGFVRPVDCLFLSRDSPRFSLYDATVLRYPFAPPRTEAEWWLMYGLATTDDTTVRALFGKCGAFDPTAKYNVATFQLPSVATTATVAHSATAAAARVMATAGTGSPWLELDGSWHMLKELPVGCAGGVVAVRGVVTARAELAGGAGEPVPTHATVDLVRCQVKLGTATFNAGKVATVVGALVAGSEIVKVVAQHAVRLRHGAHVNVTVNVHHVLATTRPMSPAAVSAVAGATLLGREALYGVWPELVAKWAKTTGMVQYAPTGGEAGGGASTPEH